jgi:hypothetical protein
MSLKVKLALTTVTGKPSIPFGETVMFPVTVTAIGKETKKAVANDLFAPIDVDLRRDDVVLEKRATDSEGSVTFQYTPPQDTPETCAKHKFKAVAAKDGVGSAEDEIEAEIQRGPCEHVIVLVTRNGVEIPHDDSSVVLSPNKTTQVRFQIQARLEPQRTPKWFRFRIGGPLARFAGIEQAVLTETPNEYEVDNTSLAEVILVLSPLSDDFERSLDAGGIGLEVRASPD